MQRIKNGEVRIIPSQKTAIFVCKMSYLSNRLFKSPQSSCAGVDVGSSGSEELGITMESNVEGVSSADPESGDAV